MSSIRSAGCLIIGDEVLNGKILDTNSHYFAKNCFNKLKIPLKKTIVCGDDRNDIIESLKILTNDCDFVITSGGIGPTHDDITYESIAEFYKLPVKIHEPTVERMESLRKDYLQNLQQNKKDAFLRMATFPYDVNDKIKVDYLYTDPKLWVPVVGLNQQVYILPGVPQLFQQLVDSLGDLLSQRIEGTSLRRYYVKTTTKESDLAPFLSSLQHKCDEEFGGNVVKLGSYPHFSWKINTISIIGNEKVNDEKLRDIVEQVLKNIGGEAKEISIEEEEKLTTTDP
ncbi:uncharacterized protein CLIB1444_11S00936 [[Candida] jaroonii]|uniref:Uncharacterized protein n=1 Tax=[Candida] jaroonii TaxID=467808 RepID=A0ACA9YCI7_9ASCO|nr:uncharacterized protein CLIB1444_11S00936 [[Candida] jaroonii]